MDSGKDEIKTAGQERIVGDEREVQENEVGAGMEENNDEEMDFEDVGFTPRQDRIATPTSAFSDSSSDDEEDQDGANATKEQKSTEDEDAASDDSSEYDDVEVESLDGRVVVRENGSIVYDAPDCSNPSDDASDTGDLKIGGENIFGDFDGAYDHPQDYAGEIGFHPLRQTEEEQDDTNVYTPNPDPGDPDWSPRSKKRIQDEAARGYDYERRPKNIRRLRKFLEKSGRPMDHDDVVYLPGIYARGRDAKAISEEIALNKAAGGNSPRTPSPFNPMRESVEFILERMKAAYERNGGEEDYVGESHLTEDNEGEDGESQDEIVTLGKGTSPTSPVSPPDSPSPAPKPTAEDIVKDDDPEQGEAPSTGSPAGQSAATLSWDDIKNLSSGSSFADDDDEDDLRQSLAEITRRASESSTSRRSSAESIEPPKVTVVSEESSEVEEGASEDEAGDTTPVQVSGIAAEDISLRQEPSGSEAVKAQAKQYTSLRQSVWATPEIVTQNEEPSAPTSTPRSQATSMEEFSASSPEPLQDDNAPAQPTVHLPPADHTQQAAPPSQDMLDRTVYESFYTTGNSHTTHAPAPVRPIVNLPLLRPGPVVNLPRRPSNGMAASIDALPASPVTPTVPIIETEQEVTAEERADAQPQGAADKPSRADSSTQTDPNALPKASVQRSNLERDHKHMVGVAGRLLKDMMEWKTSSDVWQRDAKSYKSERDAARRTNVDMMEVVKTYREMVEERNGDIEWWRQQLFESDTKCNEAKQRIAELEKKLSDKCDDCVKKVDGGQLGDIEDAAEGSLEDKSKPKEDACCKGRWIFLEKELVKAQTRAADLEKEKEGIEKKARELCQKKLEDLNAKWEQYHDKNEKAAERERKRKEDEADRQPLLWDLELGDEDLDDEFVARLTQWINIAHAKETRDSYLEIEFNDVADLLASPNLTYTGFVNTLNERGFVFRPDHFAQYVQKFYLDNRLVVPPAIRFAAERMSDDLVRAVRDLLEELDRFERARTVEATQNGLLAGQLHERDEELKLVRSNSLTIREAAEQQNAVDLQQYSERVDKLTQQLAELQKKLDDCEKHLPGLQSLDETDVIERQRKAAELQAENKRLAEQLVEAQAALEEFEKNLGSDSDSDGELEERLKQCKKHGEKLTQENENLHVQLAELNTKLDELQRRNAEQESKITAFEIDFADHQQDFEKELEKKDEKIRELEMKLETELAERAADNIDPFVENPSTSPTPPPRGSPKQPIIPAISEPSQRPDTPPVVIPPLPAPKLELPGAPSTSNPSPQKPLTINTSGPMTPIKSPLKSPASPSRTPSTPGGFNLLLGYRPEGWKRRDTRWRNSEVGKATLARLRERAIQRNREVEDEAQLRRQAYQALTGNSRWPAISREQRMANYRRFVQFNLDEAVEAAPALECAAAPMGTAAA